MKGMSQRPCQRRRQKRGRRKEDRKKEKEEKRNEGRKKEKEKERKEERKIGKEEMLPLLGAIQRHTPRVRFHGQYKQNS